jgi:glycosyltransferase involved in cell wall biosynthesis
MSDIPDILMFMRKVRPWYPRMLYTLAETCKHPFTLHVQYDDSTAFKACNDVIKRSKARYICICDDDVEFIEDNWLLTLINFLQEHKDFGCIVPYELKSTEDIETLKRVGREQFFATIFQYATCNWVAGYVSLFDRDRVPNIYCDERLPGRYGMSDVDLALQVRDAGFLVGVTTDTTVAHLYKKGDAAILEPLGVHMNDNNEMHKKHVDYMTQKWGKFYTDSEVQKAFRFYYREQNGKKED